MKIGLLGKADHMENFSGTSVKGYQLGERIGVGGFGAVYKSYQSTIGREVAIKVVLPGYVKHPEFIRRFETEARLVARLEHLHIVPLYDYWRDPEGAYLVMRLMRGGSLQDELREGSYDLETAALLMDQVTSALALAHRNKIIHRDIKPSNILLDEDGNAYITDFGIARELENAESLLAEPDMPIGSHDYLSPEQARTEPVAFQTDIYSLGVVLYEILTGQHPFPDLSPVECLFKHINEPLPYIYNLDVKISEAVNQVIQKATAKDPKHRYEDVLAMAATFREAADLSIVRDTDDVVELLTPREQEVLKHIINGKANREIASILTVELTTVKWYIRQIYHKLNVRSRVQAIVRARELNLIVDRIVPTSEIARRRFLESEALENPYKGLHAFESVDEQDFFGREKLTKKILQRFGEKEDYSRFLIIVGPSGSGKSSLVKAGLIPAFWRGDFPGSENWYIVNMLPGTHPLDELELSLIRVAAEKPENLREQLERDKRGLIRATQLILPDDSSELLLVVDQFEELFTLVDDEESRAHFLDLIYNAVTDKKSRVRVVVTLRADFYDRPLQYPEMGEMVRSRMETVLPLSAEELEQAITNPADRVGVGFEPGLVSSIIDDVHYQPGGLPLMQYALTELFDICQEHTLTKRAYHEIGGVVGALAKRAEEAYTEMNDIGRHAAQHMFLRLVTLGEGTEDTRRRVKRSELLSIALDTDAMDEVIDTFAAYRLLFLDNDPATRSPTVELAHEAILREWERLREWLNEARDDIRLQRMLAVLSKEWRENNEKNSFLLRGSRLKEFETWVAETELALTPKEHQYLAASISDREKEEAEEIARNTREVKLEKRARNVRRGLVGVFLIAAIISGWLAFRASQAEQEALRQASIGLAAQAMGELDSAIPERAVLLALEALENYPYTGQAESALALAVEGYHNYLNIPNVEMRATNVAWSPDGTYVAFASLEGIVKIWDSSTGDEIANLGDRDLSDLRGLDWSSDGGRLFTGSLGKEIAQMWDLESRNVLQTYAGHDGGIYSVDVSKDNSLLLTASADGTARAWGVESGEAELIFSGHEADVTNACWSSSNDQILTSSMDGTVRIWDAATGEEIRKINAHIGGVSSVTWSPDGTQIASSGVDGLARIWDASKGELQFTLIGHDGEVVDVDWSPDKWRLATTGRDGTIRVWDVRAGNDLFTIHGLWLPFAIAWSPDGERLTLAGGPFAIRLWDVSQQKVHLAASTPATDAQWSPDMSLIATASVGSLVHIWDANTGELITTFNGHVKEDWSGLQVAWHFGWSPSGDRIATSAEDYTVRIWDPKTGEEFHALFHDEQQTIIADWSPDGTLLATGSGPPNGSIYLWDPMTGERLAKINNNCEITHPSWSPDGTRLVAECYRPGEFSDVIIWDVSSREILVRFSNHEGFATRADWSPDGRKIVSPGADTTVRIWDSETGKELMVYSGHNDIIWDAEWSLDGTRIASGDNAGYFSIWDAETGVEVYRANFPGSVVGVEWSPDGRYIIVTGNFTPTIILRVWSSTQELIDYTKECCIFRTLNPEEREMFGLPPVNK